MPSDDQLLAAIRRINARAAARSGAADLATAIADEMLVLFDADASAVYRLDGDEIVVVGSAAVPGKKVFQRGARFPIEPEMVVARVLEEQRPVRAADYASDPSDASRRIAALGFDVVIGAPVMGDGRIWGMIYTAALGVDRLPPGSEEQLGALADLCSMAVASTEDRTQLESQRVEHEALMRVARTALGDADEPGVLAAVAREAAAMLGGPAAAVLRDGGDEMAVAAQWFGDGDARVAAGEGYERELARRAREHGGSVRLGDPDATAADDGRLALGRPVAWAAPIRLAGRYWGALIVAVDKGFEVPPDAAARVERFAELSGLVIAHAEARRALEQHAAARRALLVETLEAEERTRRTISEALHDHALQELYAARIELANAAADDRALTRVGGAIDAASRQLREAVSDLHPAVSRSGGLEAPLRTILDRAARRGGFDYELAVDVAGSDRRDDLILALVREFSQNVVKHADASQITVHVRDEPAGARLEVADDGVGLDERRAKDAPARGHIGLASARERIEAAGGSFEVDSEPGRGTRVTALVPRLD